MLQHIIHRLTNIKFFAEHSRRSMKQGNRGSSSNRIRFEKLEDRRLLAVGSFERLDGGVYSAADAIAMVPNDGAYDNNSHSAEILTQSSAVASAVDDVGFTFIFLDGVGAIPVPIGNFIVAPFVNAKAGILYTVSGEGYVVGLSDNDVLSIADANFEYNEDPENSEDLVLHVHLYLAGYGGAVVAGDAADGTMLLFSASGGGGNVEAYYSQTGTWFVSGSIPGLGEFVYESPGGVNEHFHFEIPVSSVPNVHLTATTGEDSTVAGGSVDGSIQAQWGLSAGAWAYVTAEGEDVPDGDANHDGNVDLADYILWRDRDPRADWDLDGDVDDLDFDIWAANATDIIIVTSDADDGAGSLREALSDAYSNPGPDTIVIAPTVNEIVLASTLDINSDVTILGAGQDQTSISGNNQVRPISIGGSHVTLADLTITDGFWSGMGSAIYAAGSYVTLERVTIENNENDEGEGFAINVESEGSLTLVDSTVDSNYGGGISTTNADLTITGSTISNNTAYSVGGVAFYGNGNTLTLVNSTISGNTAAYIGGVAVDGYYATHNIVNCTITNNAGASVGGLWTNGNYVNALIANSIIAGNDSDKDVQIGYTYGGGEEFSNNLIGYDPETEDLWGLDNGVNGNIVGGENNAPVVNARLAPLAYYGGLTKTHALLYDSLAIDAGENDFWDSIDYVFDQRGEEYNRIVDWDDDLDARVDIGAFELALHEVYS